MMNRRGIPKLLAEVRLHRLENFRQHGSGRAVIEIDSPHGIPTANSILSCLPATNLSMGEDVRRSTAQHRENQKPGLLESPIATVFGKARTVFLEGHAFTYCRDTWLSIAIPKGVSRFGSVSL